jgi:hypothetical protein
MFDPHLIVEAYLNSAWQDISTYARTAGAVTITRGAKDWTKQADPQQCTLTLDNTDGRFSVRNPTGPYFGTIGRNTPIRVALKSAADTFNRTLSGSWGNLDLGGTWNIGLGAGGTVQTSDWSVNPTSGQGGIHSVPAAAAYRCSLLDVVTFTDVDVAVSFRAGFSTPAGGNYEPGNIMLRVASNTDYYMARVECTPSSTVLLSLIHYDGTTIVAPTTIGGLSWSAGTTVLRVRAQIEGKTLRAKVWDATTGTEPLAWQVSGTDTVARTASSGQVGIRSGVGAGVTNTKPITFRYDDFEVRSMRFAGEVAEWPNNYSLSGKDLTASITASGITRRVGSASSPLRPTLDRYLAAQSPTCWWPLEDGKTATSGARTDGVSPAIFQVNSLGNGAISWAADTTLPGTLQAPQLTKGGSLWCGTNGNLGGTSWHISWQQKSTATSGAQVLIGAFSIGVLLLTTFTDGSIEVDLTLGNPLSPTTLMTVAAPALSTYDGQWWTFGLTAVMTGGNTNWALWLNGNVVATATTSSFTIGSVAAVTLQSPVSSTGVEFAHLAIWNSVPSNTVLGTIRTAALGYAGELAGVRIARLCMEQGVDLVQAGDYSVTGAMGPQLPANLIDLVRACAAVDLGTLAEARGTSALFYRAHSGRTNRSTAVSAALTDLAAPPAPVDDDSFTANDVVVKRVNGGSYEATLATGALSVLAPGSGGVGKYEKSYTINCATDAQLPALAGWLLGLGTVDQARWPTLVFLREAVSGTLAAALLLADLDAKVVVAGSATYKLYDDVQQLVAGYTETIAVDGHRIVFNCVPEEPYHVGVVDDGGVSRVDHAAAYTNGTLTTGATSMAVKSLDGTLWTTSGAEFPFDVIVAGERMTVTNCTGSSSPQTMTVTRSVNGVVKTHAADEQVRLFRPCYVGLE